MSAQVLDRVLNAARQLGASDVHLKAGLPPIFRIKGELRTVRDVPPLTRESIATFAVHMMNDGRGGAVGFGFMQPGTSNTGRWANAVQFANDGTIRFSTRTAGSPIVGQWGPGVWYEVDVVLDYTTLLADVYINGALAGDDVAMDPKILPASVYGVPVPLDQYGMFGDNFPATSATSVIFYDDMSVSTDPPVPVEETSWGRIKSLYR